MLGRSTSKMQSPSAAAVGAGGLCHVVLPFVVWQDGFTYLSSVQPRRQSLHKFQGSLHALAACPNLVE